MTTDAAAPRPKMTIPKSRGEVIFHFVMSAIVVFFSLLAIANLCFRVALISSTIWLAIVVPSLGGACRRAGGLRRFLADHLAVYFGRYFVDCPPHGVQPVVVRFGYQLFGRRYLQREIALEKIESVQWSPGQGTSLAGRDMKDWSVVLWFDHDDPAKRNPRAWKPDQDIHIVGPERRKELTAAFGLSFVDFLRAAGASLVPGEDDCVFVREEPEGGNVV